MKRLVPICLAALMAASAGLSTRTAAQSTSPPPPAAPLDDDAARFGALEAATSVSLSADGKRLVFVGPSTGMNSVAVVVDIATGTMTRVGTANGKPLNLRDCDWTAADRLVCVLAGVTEFKPAGRESVWLPVTRYAAVDSTGANTLPLGERDTGQQIGIRQSDGRIVDWLDGLSGNVLMARTNVPEMRAGMTGRTERGLSLDRVDTRTGKITKVLGADESAVQYITDGLGTVRIRSMTEVTSQGLLRGVSRHFYRKVGSEEWLPLGVQRAERAEGESQIPLAVDPNINAAYVLEPLEGRRALYRIALDGSMKKELVFASKEVDVANVVRVGRGGRVIGATYVTDRRQVEYFDPAYRDIATALASALPKLPLLYFVGASADERILLVRASSDVDPGHYYLFDRDRKSLKDILRARPPLREKTLSPVRAISYAAADGTTIPGYLTLPPGASDAKNLPAIVMPHGGPESRDEWGFDWLVQFFAQRGFAVLQPNYRGSAGYGDAWFQKNGFQGWKQSIGDICDGARWLLAQGVDPARMAAFGWSYGGYAALQANVLDANLFKAVVAVAPVTDLALLKEQAEAYTNQDLVKKFIGNGPHVAEGSPARQAAAFKAPVLIFQGDSDLNVNVEQARLMDKALRAAGKSTELIIYPGLEHSLREAGARADLLRRSDAFLRAQLKL